VYRISSRETKSTCSSYRNMSIFKIKERSSSGFRAMLRKTESQAFFPWIASWLHAKQLHKKLSQIGILLGRNSLCPHALPLCQALLARGKAALTFAPLLHQQGQNLGLTLVMRTTYYWLDMLNIENWLRSKL
jgi:hypothetical protein